MVARHHAMVNVRGDATIHVWVHVEEDVMVLAMAHADNTAREVVWALAPLVARGQAFNRYWQRVVC